MDMKVNIVASPILVGVIAVGVIGSMATFTVQETERSVLTTWGEYTRTIEPGLNFKVPFMQSQIPYPVTIQSISANQVNTYTVDNQELNAEIIVFYRIPVNELEFVYKNVPDYETRVLAMAVDRFKSEMGKINITQVASRRGEVRDRIEEVLSTDIANTLHIEIVDFQIPSIDYTDAFRQAVDRAAVAKTEVEKQEQERRQAEISADQARIVAEGQANAVREAAKGEADAKLLVAQAEAEAIRLRGQAEADAIRAQADALGANPNLVELYRVQQWTGEVPQWVGGGPVPLMSLDPPTK